MAPVATDALAVAPSAGNRTGAAVRPPPEPDVSLRNCQKHITLRLSGEMLRALDARATAHDRPRSYS